MKSIDRVYFMSCYTYCKHSCLRFLKSGIVGLCTLMAVSFRDPGSCNYKIDDHFIGQ